MALPNRSSLNAFRKEQADGWRQVVAAGHCLIYNADSASNSSRIKHPALTLVNTTNKSFLVALTHQGFTVEIRRNGDSAPNPISTPERVAAFIKRAAVGGHIKSVVLCGSPRDDGAPDYFIPMFRETFGPGATVRLERGSKFANLATRAYLNPQTALGRARVLHEFAEFNKLQKGEPTRETNNNTRPLARNLVQRALAKAINANNRRPKPKKNAKMPRLPWSTSR